MKLRSSFKAKPNSDGEFLWLVSLSDLMILLFVFFVALFSFSQKKVDPSDLRGSAALDQIQKKLLKWVVDRKLLESISISIKEDGLILQIKENVLFENGSAKIKSDAIEVVEAMGRALMMIPPPFRIGIEGHTDDLPVKSSRRLADNWELSVQRALSVLHALDLDEALEARTVVLGFGATRPLVPNRDHEGNAILKNQSSNRRVAIRIY